MSEWTVEKSSSRRKKDRKRQIKNKDDRRKKRKLEHDKSRKSQKIFDIEFKYKTSLPPPVGQPKLLQVPLPPDYLTRYMAAELESQRHWTLHPEGGLIVPIDVWDPSSYKPQTEEKERCDEDSELLAMLYQRTRNSSDLIDHKLNKMHYYNVNKQSWTLTPDIMTNQTRIRSVKKASDVREVDTKFANKSVMKKIEQQQQSLLSVEAIQQSFKDIDELKHPSKPQLTVVESLPIFPDDRLLNDLYYHVSFDRPPSKEVSKLPFMQELDEKDCAETLAKATKEACLRISGNDNKQWFSLYAPDPSKITELDKECEWTSEYSRRFEGKSECSHFFVRQGTEIVWGKVQHRSKLRRIETETIVSSKHEADRETFAKLPRYLNLEFVEEQPEQEEEDAVSDEE